MFIYSLVMLCAMAILREFLNVMKNTPFWLKGIVNISILLFLSVVISLSVSSHNTCVVSPEVVQQQEEVK